MTASVFGWLFLFRDSRDLRKRLHRFIKRLCAACLRSIAFAVLCESAGLSWRCCWGSAGSWPAPIPLSQLV